ncbi:Extradiol ring-cleavage dioxygenase, class III enzyme, subunit B [Lophiotrema nucula]|uniref:Extradiol ring-cleavage dioxygenase, class III enzyme, subunit B n=1 Tax=Lophiotrema nucula TaxID=690887 RepID=A0A6A5YUX7_9PLEO|nr:Extradiol ring-cleavage dioxygenase, class III enzyme, subunit B [Lophiotrema nucula]
MTNDAIRGSHIDISRRQNGADTRLRGCISERRTYKDGRLGTIEDFNVSDRAMPSATTPTEPLPVYFIGHAGVGLLFDESEDNKIVQANLRAIGKEIQTINPPPKAILVFSGHFEAGEIHGPGVIEVNVKKTTPILHDFVNDFHDTKPFVYDYDWPHRDAPELAHDVWKHLVKAGIKAKRVERGVDHGVWVPFKIMFPPEDPLEVPIIEVSTFHGYDLESQIRLGEAVRSLRNQGYLIVGSGMAVHSFASIAEIHSAKTEEDKRTVADRVLAESRTFDSKIREALSKHNAGERSAALFKLEELPEFKRSHPTVEHFTPLLVAAGAADDSSAEPLGVDVVRPGFSYLNVRFS